MKWSEVQVGDTVFHHRVPKQVLSIEPSENVWDYEDRRAYVEVMFHDPDAPWFSFTDGFYCILASERVRVPKEAK